jgi:hypothetical protein
VEHLHSQLLIILASCSYGNGCKQEKLKAKIIFNGEAKWIAKNKKLIF